MLAMTKDMLGMIVGFELEPHVPAVTESHQAQYTGPPDFFFFFLNICDSIYFSATRKQPLFVSSSNTIFNRAE